MPSSQRKLNLQIQQAAIIKSILLTTTPHLFPLNREYKFSILTCCKTFLSPGNLLSKKFFLEPKREYSQKKLINVAKVTIFGKHKLNL